MSDQPDKASRHGSRHRVYLAGPLFSRAEREFNGFLKRELSVYFDVFLPQEDGCLLAEMTRNGIPPEQASRRVFECDIAELDRCTILVVVLDGRAVDEGAAFELGYAFAKGKTCVGLQTDERRLLRCGNNPMIDGPCSRLFHNVDALLAWADQVSTVGLQAYVASEG